jgi:hypothetical protein
VLGVNLLVDRVGEQPIHHLAPSLKHPALVDVALVGDLAHVDARRLREQQQPRDAGGGAGAGAELCEALGEVAAKRRASSGTSPSTAHIRRASAWLTQASAAA